MSTDLISFEISPAEFTRVSSLLYDLCKIRLVPGKEGLVKSRLGKRMRTLELESIDAYLDYVERDKTGQELTRLIDSLTTNKTSFFREPQHFDYLRRILPGLVAAKSRIRIWSAACSSGEEPYSIAILLREEIPAIDRLDVRILATDISAQILAKAKRGCLRAGDHSRSARLHPAQVLYKCPDNADTPLPGERQREIDGAFCPA